MATKKKTPAKKKVPAKKTRKQAEKQVAKAMVPPETALEQEIMRLVDEDPDRPWLRNLTPREQADFWDGNRNSLGVTSSRCTPALIDKMREIIEGLPISITDMCRILGISPGTHTKWCNTAASYIDAEENGQLDVCKSMRETHGFNLPLYVRYYLSFNMGRAMRNTKMLTDVVDMSHIASKVTGQKDPKALLEVISRLERHDYGRGTTSAVEVTGPGGGAIQHEHTFKELAMKAAAELDAEVIDVEEVKEDE